jgi:hypothetical protein
VETELQVPARSVRVANSLDDSRNPSDAAQQPRTSVAIVAAVRSQKTVHVSMIARLAGIHAMRPLLSVSSPSVRRFGASRVHHCVFVTHISLAVLVMGVRAELGLLWSAVSAVYLMLAGGMHAFLLSTQMRRELLKELLKSFEVGYIMFAVLVLIGCERCLDFVSGDDGESAGYFTAQQLGWTVDTSTQLALYVLERVSFSVIAVCIFVLLFSTGAIPNFPSRVFQLCQALLLVAFVYDHVFYWQQGNSADAPELHFTFLFLNTTVREVSLSAATTLTFFLVKQLLKSLLKPQYSQLLHPRYKIKEYSPPALERTRDEP